MKNVLSKKLEQKINPTWEKIIIALLVIGLVFVFFFILFGEAIYLKSLFCIGVNVSLFKIVITILITLSLLISTFYFGLNFIKKIRG